MLKNIHGVLMKHCIFFDINFLLQTPQPFIWKYKISEKTGCTTELLRKNHQKKNGDTKID